ncbi:MAG: ferrochelatase [Eggerthellaceae bacterium]|nr:ferrochelatase [Eggerthellaceae bacterium]
MATQSLGVILVDTGIPSVLDAKEARKYLYAYKLYTRVTPVNKPIWFFAPASAMALICLVIIFAQGTLPSFLIFFGITLLFAALGGASVFIKKVLEKYRHIWLNDESSYAARHETIVTSLNEAFEEEQMEACAKVAYAYSHPTIEEIMQDLRDEEIKNLVVLPLCPQSSYARTSVIKEALERSVKKLEWSRPITFVDNYHNNPTYIKAVSGSIRYAGFDHESDDRLLFSYESVLLSDIVAGDTFELQTGATSLQVASDLDLERNRWTIGYQNRYAKKRKWLAPFTSSVLSRWAEGGEGKVYVVCPGYAIDNVETSVNVGTKLKQQYIQNAAKYDKQLTEDDFVYIPCLNESKAHVNVLLDVIKSTVK